jgi:phospholipase/carboxylesterase
MNRLASPKAFSAKFSSSALDISAIQFPTTTSFSAWAGALPQRRNAGQDEGVCLFAPIHYERRYAYPLLIWLHGEGGSERELRRLMPYVSVRNYVAAAARGEEAGSEHSPGGCTWGQTPEAIADAAERVGRCIELAQQRFNIHPDRVFLAGQGPGGTMALRLAMQYPLGLAGAVSLSGPAPRGHCPLGRVNQARTVPLLLATCRDSATYPPMRVADDLRLLHSAGFSLALRQYPCLDELTTDMLADMDRWLMHHVCQPESAAMI